jgi:DNA-binding CsgD family transcriptional regulator
LEVTIQRLELSDHTIYVLYFEWPLEEGQCWSGPNEKREKNNQVSEPLDRALQSLEKAHNRYQRDLAYHIEVNLLPTLEKMSREPDLQIRNSYQEVLIRELSSLSERSTMEVDRDLLRLTPKEMEVCKYIQAGLSSKEIAEMMYSSFDTIQTHRKNIRRKMGLKGKKTPLCTFLRVEKRLPMEDRAPHV